MCARLLACPLCSQPGFLTLDALRAGLVSVATRPLACPVCNEVLLGIDKLTIHLFSHSINQAYVEPTKVIDISTGIDVCRVVRGVHNVPLQTWNVVGKKTNSEEKLEGKMPSQVLVLPKDRATEERVEGGHKYLSKLSNQMIFLQKGKEEEEERRQEFGSKSIILVQGKDSMRIEESVKQTNLIFIAGKEGLRKDAAERSQGQDSLVFLQEKQQEKDPGLNHQMVFLQGKDHPREKDQDFAAKPESNQVILLQNSDQVFGQGLEFGKSGSGEGQKVDGQEKIWDRGIQVQFPVMMNFEECKKSVGETPAGAKSNLEESQGQFGPEKDKSERCDICDICGFFCADKNILGLHKQVVHLAENNNLNAVSEHLFKNYPCHLCTKVFKMRGSLMVHMRVAHTGYHSNSVKDTELANSSENGYNCPTCGKSFKKEQHVTQHLKTHEGKQWECDVCSKMFTTKYFLKKHKRLHSGEMPYKCNICDKTFTFQQSYHKHRLYHKDDKPHTCNTCGRSFKELSTLHNHERIHTGEKPFPCEICGKCFRQRVSYLVHRRIHTGVMPYKCTACEKSFRYKVSLRTHKCTVQPPGSSQPESLVQKLLQPMEPSSSAPSNTPEVPDLNLDLADNKYVLIVNEQGQHILTRQSEVDAARSNKPAEANDSADYQKRPLEEAQDFFSMVMSPLGNDLSSPSTEMEHLRLSSPPSQSHVDDIMSQDNYPVDAGALHTINEESLKELLYGIGNK